MWELCGKGDRSPWRISGLLGDSIMQTSDFEGILLGAQASDSQLPQGYSILRLSGCLYHPPNALRRNWKDSPWSHLESFGLPLSCLIHTAALSQTPDPDLGEFSYHMQQILTILTLKPTASAPASFLVPGNPGSQASNAF